MSLSTDWLNGGKRLWLALPFVLVILLSALITQASVPWGGLVGLVAACSLPLAIWGKRKGRGAAFILLFLTAFFCVYQASDFFRAWYLGAFVFLGITLIIAGFVGEEILGDAAEDERNSDAHDTHVAWLEEELELCEKILQDKRFEIENIFTQKKSLEEELQNLDTRLKQSDELTKEAKNKTQSMQRMKEELETRLKKTEGLALEKEKLLQQLNGCALKEEKLNAEIGQLRLEIEGYNLKLSEPQMEAHLKQLREQFEEKKGYIASLRRELFQANEKRLALSREFEEMGQFRRDEEVHYLEKEVVWLTDRLDLTEKKAKEHISLLQDVISNLLKEQATASKSSEFHTLTQ